MTNGSGSDYTSILDKTDWRKTIHKALEEAVMSIGRGEEFYYNVEQAIESMKAQYPNWDATTEINKMVAEVTEKHNKIASDWIDSNPEKWAYPWNRAMKLLEWRTAMYLEILQRLKDIAGKHRMLLWGVKRVPEGRMGPSEEDAPGDETDP